MVYLGDSITHGQYIDPSYRWTTLIDEALDETNRDTRIHIQTWNRGVSGETTRMGLERFPDDVQKVQPEVVTLQFGMNDCNCWLSDRGLPRTSEWAFQANLVEMIQRARHFGAKHVILSTNHVSMKRKEMLNGERYEVANQRYNQLVREVASQTGATLCDVARVFANFDDAELEKLLLPSPDLLHLSIEGHRIYADAIRGFVELAVADVARKLGA